MGPAMKTITNDLADIKDGIDKIMHRPGGVAGAAFRELVGALDEYGFTVYRHKFTARYIRGLGFKSNTLVDVGVNRGTPEFWDAFPGKKIVLVEPLSEILQAAIEENPGYSFSPLAAGAGSENTEMTINVMPVTGHSSFLKRKDEADSSRTVPVVRLDEFLTTGGFEPPFGLKIDTEGFEIEVLKGCSGVMNDVEFVIAEASIKRMFENGYKFSDLIKTMADYGFQLMDILSSSGGPPNNLDCLFVKETDERLRFKV